MDATSHKITWFEYVDPFTRLSAPDKAGWWTFRDTTAASVIRRWPRVVLVEETPSAGRFCKELQMGGHAICGFQPWRGVWVRVEPIEPPADTDF